MFDTCSCQTARCFNKSKGVLITGSKLKAFRNPQPSWGFSVHKKKPGAKCLPGFRFIRQIAVLTANLLHRLQNTLI
ncbi:hypothetical protein F8C22_09190 [Escherichia coli]|nr:hypothetical protein [Escherichia coli]RWZ93855.1 hypothetical protein EQ823_24365 [Escherichia coli]